MARFRCTLTDLLLGVVALACLLAAGRLTWQSYWGTWQDWVSDVAWSPDGRQLAVAVRRGESDNRVAVLDTESGAWTRELLWPSDLAPILQFTQDGRLVVAGDELAVLDLQGGNVTILDRRPYAAIDVSADGKWLAATGYTGLSCWDLASGRLDVHRDFASAPCHPWHASQVRFSSDAQSLFLWNDSFFQLVRFDRNSASIVGQAHLWLDGEPQLAVADGESAVVAFGNAYSCTSHDEVVWYSLEAVDLGATHWRELIRGVSFEHGEDRARCLSRDGSLVACVFTDRTTEGGGGRAPWVRWQRLAGDPMPPFDLRPVQSLEPSAVALSPSGRLACAFGSSVQVAILSSGRVVLDVPTPWPSPQQVWQRNALFVLGTAVVCLGCLWRRPARPAAAANRRRTANSCEPESVSR